MLTRGFTSTPVLLRGKAVDLGKVRPSDGTGGSGCTTAVLNELLLFSFVYRNT